MSENEEATLGNENSADTGTDVDWQKRYTDTQAAYTQSQQELKAAQEAAAAWDDEQAVLARIAEKYPHLMADEEEVVVVNEDDDLFVDDDDDPRLAKLAELEQKAAAHDEWIAEQAQREATKQFHADLSEEAGDRELSRQAKEWIFNETVKLGDGRENLKKAYAAWVEYEDGVGEEYLKRVKQSKRAPHVPAGGQTPNGEEVDWDKLQPHERDELMAEMVKARQ